MKVFYPQSALEGFGLAIASKLGVSVRFTTGKPRTDGHTVYLPQITGALTEAGFKSMCGIALHEAAHVYFDSCRPFNRYATTELKAACFNAVLDIADETRMENVIAHASQLFGFKNMEASTRIVKSKALLGNDKVWSILAGAMLSIRVGLSRSIKQDLEQAGLYLEMCKVYHVLKKAKTRKARNITAKYKFRGRAQVDALIEIADELVKLLEHHGQDQGLNGQPLGQAGAGQDEGDGVGGPGAESQIAADGASSGGLGEGEASNPGPGTALAGEKQGEESLEGDPSHPSANAGGNGASSGAGSAASSGSYSQMSQQTYAIMKPALMGPIERIAHTDDADGIEDGHYSGPKLGRHLERAAIDGKCFGRKMAENENLHVTISLDKSGSMQNFIQDAAAVAQAFMDAVKPVATTLECSYFDDCHIVCKDFKDVGACIAGTETHLATEWADKRLAGLGGRRVAIVVTDGMAGNMYRTAQSVQLLRSHGVQVIGVAYRCDPKSIMASMPGAHVLAASDPLMLAAQLTRVAAAITAN